MPEFNYNNRGYMWQNIANMKPSVSGALPGLQGTNNPLAKSSGSSLIGGIAKAGLNAATGGIGGIISQVLNIVPSIFQGITGASQLRKASKIESQNPRPEAEIAPSINKLVDYTYGQTLDQDIPGGEMYRNEIKGATAAGMRAASELGSGAEAYGMLGQLVGREQNQFGSLAKLTAQRVAGKEDAYANTLPLKAEEENRVWGWNKAEPYLQAAAIAQQLRDSGLRNVNAGMKNVFGAAAEATSPDFNSSLLWGNGGSGATGDIPMEDLMKVINSLKG